MATPAPEESRSENDHTALHVPAADPAPDMTQLHIGTQTDLDATYPEGKPDGEAAPGSLSIPGYEVLGVLGRGGMGVVYKARQKGLNRIVALKMILAAEQAGPELVARFRSEAEAVARLHHPNIVQIHHVGEHNGHPFFTLEYLDGGSLAKQFNGNPQPPRRAAETMKTLAGAVHAAHLHGVVHRDLKPANVLVDSDGLLKVTDFGLAKQLDDESGQTHSGTILGTPSYMAPEQAEGRTRVIGPPTDVYALGSMLYEALTGRPPFRGESVLDTLEQVRTQEPVPPRRLQPKVPLDLETICLKCLQKEPARRYPSAAELEEDLGRFLAGEPIRARPVGPAERLWRWARRNPWVASLMAAVAFLLVAATVGSLIFAWVLALERDAKEIERAAAVKARIEADENRELAENARQLADTNARLASEQSNLSLQTLHGLAVEVQGQLRDKPALEGLRESLLKYAMDGMDRIAGKSAKSALGQRILGGIHQRKGDLQLRIGKSADALNEYRKGADVFEGMVKTLAEDDPEREIARWNLGVLCERLGEVSHQLTGDAAGTAEYYRRAMEQRRALAAITPRAPGLRPDMVQRALASTYAKLSDLNMLRGDPAGAGEQNREAIKILEQLTAGNAAGPADKRALAVAYLTAGEVGLRSGGPDAARPDFEKCLTLRKELVDADKKSILAQRDLAAILGRMGDTELQWRRRPYEALVFYRQAHPLHESLHKVDPKNVENRKDLSQSHYRLGTAALWSGDRTAADAHFQACRKLREAMANDDPKNLYKKLEYLLVQARCGQHAEVVSAADTMATDDPGLLYFIGCSYALCVSAVAPGKAAGELTTGEQELKKRYTAKAVQAIGRAIDKGFKDREALQLDPDLEPIQKDAEYAKLLGRLKKG